MIFVYMKECLIITSSTHEKQDDYKSSLFSFLIVPLELHVLILVGELWSVLGVAAGIFVLIEVTAEVVTE